MMITERLRPERPASVAPGEHGDPRIRVLIADRDGLARRVMCDALRDAGMVIAATAREAGEALQLARHYRPTIVLTDPALPPHGAVWLVQQVRADVPETRVLTVSADDEEIVLEALRAGAVGHIGKDIEPVDLARLVALAAAGEAIIPRRLQTPLLALIQGVPDAGWRPVRSRLTTREWEIVEMLEDGVSTTSIAERLVLSPSTVYSHVKSVLRKLDVHSRDDAVVAAERLRREEAVGINPPIALR